MKAMEKLIELQTQALQNQSSQKENAQPIKSNQQARNQQSGSDQGSPRKRKDSEHQFAGKASSTKTKKGNLASSLLSERVDPARKMIVLRPVINPIRYPNTLILAGLGFHRQSATWQVCATIWNLSRYSLGTARRMSRKFTFTASRHLWCKLWCRNLNSGCRTPNMCIDRYHMESARRAGSCMGIPPRWRRRQKWTATSRSSSRVKVTSGCTTRRRRSNSLLR